MIEQLQETEKARQEMKRQAMQVAFEKAQAAKHNCDYEQLKANLDKQEAEVGSRYLVGFSADWDVWQEAWQAAQEQMLQAIHSDMKDTYYWDGAEYVVDWVNEYEMDLERGEIAELEKWKRTKEVKVYVAAIYSNEDDFELVEFESEEKAKNAVQENLLMLDTLEKQPPRHHLL